MNPIPARSMGTQKNHFATLGAGVLATGVGNLGLYQRVMVTSKAFDAKTGKEVWKVPDRHPEYLTVLSPGKWDGRSNISGVTTGLRRARMIMQFLGVASMARLPARYISRCGSSGYFT